MNYRLLHMSIKKGLLFVIVAELMVGLLALNHYGLTLQGLQATTRFSGRLSLFIFTFIFLFLPFSRERLSRIFSSNPFLLFAVAHGIHLFELLSYVYLSQADLIPVRLAGGFLAYIFIFLMPFVQTSFLSGKIDRKKYSLAENIYDYYVWFIFFMSYLPRVQGKLPNVGGTYAEFLLLFVWVCILLGVRIFLQFRVRKVSPSQ